DRLLLPALEDLDLADAALVAGGEPEVCDYDPALGADDAQHIVLLRDDRAGDFGDDLVREFEHGGRPFIDAALTKVSAPPNLLRIEEGLPFPGPGNQSRHRDRVAADIENAAAGGIVGEKPVFRLIAAHVEAEARADDADGADDAALDEFDQLFRLRMHAVHEG